MKQIFNTTFARIFISTFLTTLIVLVGTNLVIKQQLDSRFDKFLTHQESMELERIDPRRNPRLHEPQFVTLTNDYRKDTRNAIILSSMTGIIIASALGFVVSKQITNPLNDLKRSIKKVKDNNFKHRAKVHGSEEIQELTIDFNTLISELEKAEHLREELVSDVSHELKTPITKVRGRIEGIIDGIYDNSKQQLTKSLDSLGQLEYLIEKLQNLVEIKSQKHTPQFINIYLNKFVTNLLEDFDHPQIKTVIEIDTDVVIKADKFKFKEILDNLVENAFKYSSRGVITIAYKNNSLSITDTGMGIAKDELPFIFERFYRAEKSRNKTTGGLGLGLSIVKELVEIHGWTIHVESTVGKGSTFTIQF